MSKTERGITMKIRTVFFILLTFTLCLFSSMTASATTGYKCGPTGDIDGNGITTIPGTIKAGKYGKCYIHGECVLKTTAAVDLRSITVDVYLYDSSSKTVLAHAEKTKAISTEGPATSGTHTWKGDKLKEYTKGDICYYKVRRSNFTKTMSGSYSGFLSY